MISQTAKRRIERIIAGFPDWRTEGPRAVVLSYHSIHPTKRLASASPDQFERSLDWLKDHCDILPLSTITDAWKRSKASRPMVAITFDDGYDDNYLYAFPSLVNRQIPATFFITTGLAEGNPSVIARLARLWRTQSEEVGGLTWSQIGEMRAAGLDFGAHTCTHRNLALLEDGEVRAELMDSKRILEDHLQISVTSFAYPFGNPRLHFSKRTMRLAATAGFEIAASVQLRGLKSNDSQLSIPRFPVTSDSLQVLSAKVHGRLDFLGRVRDRLPPWAIRLTSTESPSRLRDTGLEVET